MFFFGIQRDDSNSNIFRLQIRGEHFAGENEGNGRCKLPFFRLSRAWLYHCESIFHKCLSSEISMKEVGLDLYHDTSKQILSFCIFLAGDLF